jgi:V-type H+-transporting ATPase proteolipid subunit
MNFEQPIAYIEEPLHALYETVVGANECPEYAVVFGALGAALGLAAANAGAAYGIATSCLGFLALGGGAHRADQSTLMKGIIPAIMASVRGVYGLIISILIGVEMVEGNYSLFKGFAHFFSGLCVGLSGYASGYCMGVVGHYGMKAVARRPTIYMSLLLIIIFAEALGLYGLIIALILLTKGNSSSCHG